jgi:hypothetical protein
VKDISPLASLPRLKNLNISDTYIEDVSPLLECKALEELSIRSADEIKDITPILNHPTLKILYANDEIKAKFENREALLEAGTPESMYRAVCDALNAGSEAAEKALTNLCLYARNFSSGDHNALDVIFAGKAADEEDDDDDYDEDSITVTLAEVDALLEKYGAELSTGLLASLVEATLRAINENCYSSTIPAVRELVRRGDLEGQKRTVNAYIKACEYYDAGHRHMEDSVQDQLIDNLFPNFKAEPLAELLAWCETDHLNSESGDCMDALFVPAFEDAKATGNDEVKKQLEAVFVAYYREAIGYYGAAYFEGLIAALKPYFTDTGAFDEVDNEVAALQKIQELLNDIQERIAGKNVNVIETLIMEIGNTIPAELLESFYTALNNVMKYRVKVSIPVLLRYFELSEAIPDVYRGMTMVENHAARLLAEAPEEAQAYFDRVYNENNQNKRTWLKGFLQRAMETAAANDAGEAVRESLRRALVKYSEQTYEEVKAAELRALFAYAMGDWQHYDERPAMFARALKELDALDGPLQTEFFDENPFVNHFIGMVNDKRYDEAVAIFKHLDKLLMGPRSLKRVLAQGIGLATVRKDAELEKICLERLPEDIDHDILAYNLACLYAVKGEREKVLQYARIAINAGKTANQFMQDSDFDHYKKDPEFLDAIGYAGTE